MVGHSKTSESKKNDPRERVPKNAKALQKWVLDYTGIEIADRPVCRDHSSPFQYFADLFLERPPLALVLGPRGGGKSFLSALNTHLTSRFNPKHGTRILGGSRAQSEQVYRALREVVQGGEGKVGSDEDSIAKLMKGEAIYHNGSDVSILAASSRSVRGPHVPSLKLDEVDEIPPELREAAMGMCMNRHGSSASVVMTSTWHRLNGPMATLMDHARAKAFPLYTFCTFEVLEHCDEKRSGRRVGGEAGFENCPRCPIKPWCHAERDRNGDQPLAKLSNGHYGIDSLIQKVRSISARTFESDYLCKGPRSEGRWFPTFDQAKHTSHDADYDPHLPVQLAIDSGVFTGAVFFQVKPHNGMDGSIEEVRVFAEYLAENLPAEQCARAIMERGREHFHGRFETISTDPAGGSRNAIGPTVIGEYERVGLQPLKCWPSGALVRDGLALIESFVNPADERSRLRIHPRCVNTIRAFENYRRARRGGQLQDYPEDPQHPYEDMMDALRGGLKMYFPEGRVCRSSHLARVPARQVF